MVGGFARALCANPPNFLLYHGSGYFVKRFLKNIFFIFFPKLLDKSTLKVYNCIIK